jgi:PAS domain S-box-containing protein
MSASTAPLRAPDVLADPLRVAAARRLLVEVAGPAAFDRLSGVAARLLGSRHAKVTLFPEDDVVVGGHGLPAGTVGGRALLTGALSAVVVRSGGPLVVPDATADARLVELPAVTSGQVRSYLGVPLVAASGHVVGALAVYDPAPHDWSTADAEALGQLAGSVVAELELAAAISAIGTSQVRLEVALEASAIGIWERDLRSGSVHWDRRCAAVFGLGDAVQLDSMPDLLTRHIHPDDHDAVREEMATALAERGEFTVESRVLRPDGSVRWTVSRGRVITDLQGEPTRVLGTVLDVTDVRESAQRRMSAVQRAAAIAEVAAELAGAAGMEQLAEIALRGAQVLGARSSALAVFDAAGSLRLHLTSGLVDAVRDNADVELPRGGIEIELDDLLPTQHVARHGRSVLLADRDEAVARFPAMAEVNEILGLGALAALPLRVEGRLLGSFVVTWTTEHAFAPDDVEVLEALTAQIGLAVSRLRADAERDAAVAAMVDANRQLQLLADAGRVLSGSLDVTAQVSQLADLLTPALADWCWVVVTDEHGRPHQAAVSHRDPARRDEVAAYVGRMLAQMTEESGPASVLRTGRPVVVPQVDWAHVERALPDPAAREALARLDIGSVVIVPLSARGQTMGALGLLTSAARGPHTAAEVETAVEIGRRAGLSLRHARVFGQQRALADALQRSMLTEPPQPEQCEIVVRYVPASEGAEIGGDWYDAFLQPGGTVVLAIGDVVGHDVRAAAAMGQVRGLLRGIGYSRGGSPAEVLTELDRAVQGLALDTLATAVVARLETEDPRTAGGRDETLMREGEVLLRWASAGHPPPVVLTPDGQAHVLDGEGPDLLLGVSPDCRRTDRSVVLAPGTTVLLHTDGLVERRDRDLDAGTEELLEVLRSCASLPLEKLCDRVLGRMFLPDAEDDVALLAFRLR